LADFNNFWHVTSAKNVTQVTSFCHLTLILSLRYLVKCRSQSLAIYNSEFILDSACVGSKMINWLATIVSQKVTRVTSHSLYYSMCSKCSPPVRMQVANVDTTWKQQAQQPAFYRVV